MVPSWFLHTSSILPSWLLNENKIPFSLVKVKRFTETKITANFENEILNVLYTKVSFRIIGEGSQARKHTPIYLTNPGAFILEEGPNPLTESFKIDYFIATTNKWMREVFKELGIQKKSSTIVSRHTVATHLKFAGASKEYIQESLGYSSIKTTENYLDSFER